MEHRRKRTARNRTRRLDKQAVAKNSTIIPASLPDLAELIAYGEITLGVLRPIGCVATATDGHNCLAMLVRRRGETLFQLLTRLDRPSTRHSLKISTPTRLTPTNSQPRMYPIAVLRRLNIHTPCQHGLGRTLTKNERSSDEILRQKVLVPTWFQNPSCSPLYCLSSSVTSVTVPGCDLCVQGFSNVFERYF